jgi:protein-disulfide isomerase
MAVLVLLIGGMVGLFVAAGGKDDSAVINTEFEGDAKIVQADDYTQGNPDSGVVLIEYGDFECPACQAFFPIVSQLKEDRGDDFQLVYRHFPLTAIHPNALAGHRAAEAAGNQGKFWEMHDLLFERQREWSASSGTDIGEATTFFETLAQELELDMERYNTDFASDETLQKINRFVASGEQFDATATPTLVLNGEKIPTPSSYEALEAVIEAEIAKVNGTDNVDTEATEESDSEN